MKNRCYMMLLTAMCTTALIGCQKNAETADGAAKAELSAQIRESVSDGNEKDAEEENGEKDKEEAAKENGEKDKEEAEKENEEKDKEETEEENIKEEAEAQKDAGVTKEPQAFMEWQMHEESFCAEDGTELAVTAWNLPRLVGSSFPGQEKINAAFLEAMEQTLKKVKQEDADEEEMYRDGCVYAMAKSAYEWNKEDAEEFGTKQQFIPYSYERGYELMRADDEVISFKSITETYLGGAHGSLVTAGENYDAKSGEKLLLSDIWTDETLFRKTCKREILALAEQMIKTQGDIFFSDYKENVPKLIEDGLWYFSENGLVFISQEYMLQPYAAGTVEFEIAYDKLEGCLK